MSGFVRVCICVFVFAKRVCRSVRAAAGQAAQLIQDTSSLQSCMTGCMCLRVYIFVFTWACSSHPDRKCPKHSLQQKQSCPVCVRTYVHSAAPLLQHGIRHACLFCLSVCLSWSVFCLCSPTSPPSALCCCCLLSACVAVLTLYFVCVFPCVYMSASGHLRHCVPCVLYR